MGRSWLLVAPISGFFLLVFVTPLSLLLVISAFTSRDFEAVGLHQYLEFFSTRLNLEVLVDTIRLGFSVMLVTLFFGYPIAYFFVRASRLAQSILIMIIITPLLTSTIVRTFAWIVILGSNGIVGSVVRWLGISDRPYSLLSTHIGVVMAAGQIEMPLMILPLIAVMSRIDHSLIEGSTSLGASEFQTFLHVVVPLSVPGIVAGCILVFAQSMSAFVTQTLVGGGRLIYMPFHIYEQAVGLQNWPFAAALCVILLLSVLCIVTVMTFAGRLLMKGTLA